MELKNEQQIFILFIYISIIGSSNAIYGQIFHTRNEIIK